MSEDGDARNYDLAPLEERLGHAFSDRALLVRALTHASTRVEETCSNERLEFLGDAILGAIVSDHLYRTHPDDPEGRMTKVRSLVVSRRTLGVQAERLGLRPWLIVGRMFPSPEAITRSILSNAYEAIIGAIYLDGGFEAASAFVHRHLGEVMRRAADDPSRRDFKSVLGQLAQAERLPSPVYEILSTAGPDHTKTFEARVRMGETAYPEGYGRSKKEAEQHAAAAALLAMGRI